MKLIFNNSCYKQDTIFLLWVYTANAQFQYAIAPAKTFHAVAYTLEDNFPCKLYFIVRVQIYNGTERPLKTSSQQLFT